MCRAVILSRVGQSASGYAWFSPGKIGLFMCDFWFGPEPPPMYSPFVLQILVAVVARRRLGEQDPVRRVAGHAEPHVVGLHRAVGRERARRVDRALLVVVGPNVQASLGGVLRRRAGGDVREALAGVRLAVLVAGLAADAVRHLGQREQVAFVRGIDEYSSP